MKYYLLLLLFPLFVGAQSDFVAAEKLLKAGNKPQAELLLKKFVAENPNHPKALEYLGDINGAARKWDAALGYYQKLTQLNPKVANYHYKYGGVLGMIAKESNKFKALGLIDDIKASFEKAIKLDPKHIEARWALIELYLQLPGIVGGSENKAIAYAAQLQSISPVDGHLAKGHISEYFGRYATAEKHYKNAITVGGSKTTYQTLANLYKNKMKNPEKANAVLEEYSKKIAS